MCITDRLAVFVDGMFQFDLYFVDTVGHDFPFLFGEMQCFIHFVREEIIVFDVLP